MNILFQGNLTVLSSFTLVNRRLVAGLRAMGHTVAAVPCDGAAHIEPNATPPDLYLFHGHQYDFDNAPGRMNVFILSYEYYSLRRDEAAYIARLNAAFDLVLVPATFLAGVLRDAGLRLPIEVVPWGADDQEFHPRRRPVRLPNPEKFTFLYLGAVNERKGTDRLLCAYHEEFTATEQVCLVIKEAFRDPTYAAWAEDLERRYSNGDGPQVVWRHEETKTVAGYYTAADCGVFPHRGEGFGLPMLECLASGRSVIVTDGAAPIDFCSDQNSRRIPARRVTWQGRVALAPNRAALRRLMRAAYNAGKIKPQAALRISETVHDWTWERTCGALDSALRQHGLASPPTKSRREGRASTPAVIYSYAEKGQTSWRKVVTELDRALIRSGSEHRSYSRLDRLDFEAADIFIGQSEYCLEGLLRAEQVNPQALKIVHQECTVLGDRVAILNREREACGLRPEPLTPMNRWRNHQENLLANYILVGSTVARGLFLNNGFPPEKIKVIPYGLRIGEPKPPRAQGKIRFLFIGTNPFIKGIRLLFEAWERAKLKHAELVCLTDQEVLRSPVLLRYLVKNPNIVIKKLVAPQALGAEYEQVDCQVLPSLHDTFSMAIGEGMALGKPAIVSTSTGIQDLITHGQDGYIVKTDEVGELTRALLNFAESRQRLIEMGVAARATAKRYPWRRFRREVVQLIGDLWAEHARRAEA